jgi:hypothetical protein
MGAPRPALDFNTAKYRGSQRRECAHEWILEAVSGSGGTGDPDGIGCGPAFEVVGKESRAYIASSANVRRLTGAGIDSGPRNGW